MRLIELIVLQNNYNSMSEKLKIDLKDFDSENNLQVVNLTGDFDKAGYNDVKADLNKMVKTFEGKTLVFDFGGVQFINSEGIGYLLEVNNFLAKKDKKFVIIGVSKYVDDIFQTIGIHDIVKIHDKLSDVTTK